MTQLEVFVLIIPAVLGLVGLFKPLLEASLLKPANPLHDPLLRILTVVLAVLGSDLVYLVRTPHPNALGVWSTAGVGLIAGLSTIGLYHAAQGNQTAPALGAEAQAAVQELLAHFKDHPLSAFAPPLEAFTSIPGNLMAGEVADLHTQFATTQEQLLAQQQAQTTLMQRIANASAQRTTSFTPPLQRESSGPDGHQGVAVATQPAPSEMPPPATVPPAADPVATGSAG